MKIYTKGGDKGGTSLLGGTRVSKSDIRIQAYGSVDELNAYIGLLRDLEVHSVLKERLNRIQNELFQIGSELACDKKPEKYNLITIQEAQIQNLEKEIDAMELELEPLKNFILPGGNVIVSHCHIARSISRRVERNIVVLSENENINSTIIRYMNRLSDYLFVLARKLAKDLGVKEIKWKPTAD